MPKASQNDLQVLRDLVKQYVEITQKPIQEERRRLWSDLNSLKPRRPMILATYGMWNVWCREVFSDKEMKCEAPFFRAHERGLRMALFQDTVGDDFILEPWLTEHAALEGGWGRLFGVDQLLSEKPEEGGAGAYRPAIAEWSDMAKLKPARHRIDEAATAEKLAKLQDAVGDLIEINLSRAPAFNGFMADVSWNMTTLRGLEQMMIDMYESPKELHALAAFIRDATLAAQDAAEAAGDYGLADHGMQEMPYCSELQWRRPNARGRKRKELWGFCAAQEFELISPKMHNDFLLEYQLPIVSKFGLTAYGCCENLTSKIDMLRRIPNLRVIAVTPRANVRSCAEQIGRKYVLSWRPNPTDMVCCGFDETLIRKTIRDGVRACKGLSLNIHLKDVETLEGDLSRLARWTKIVREECQAW